MLRYHRPYPRLATKCAGSALSQQHLQLLAEWRFRGAPCGSPGTEWIEISKMPGLTEENKLAGLDYIKNKVTESLPQYPEIYYSMSTIYREAVENNQQEQQAL